ncbi:MAG: cation acetate symporter [Bacillota bacterium]|nr:cation acetate symporter [Bacillota bacterium]MDW7729988.1 cation acetate symporter [Bacillota bacterium]
MEPRGEVFVLGLILSIIVLLISVLISVWARRFTRNLGDYYVAGRSIGAINNGLAMVSLALSLTTFIGLTALIIEGLYIAVAVYASFTAAFIGLLLLAAPYLRRHKSFTTMAFISERYGSNTLRYISVVVMMIVSVLYLAGNLKGIGIVFYFLLGVPEVVGIVVGGLVVTLYVTLGGMYGVTYNQTFQTIVLLFCLMFPVAIVLRTLGASGWAFPPLGYGDMVPLMTQTVPHYFWAMVVHPVVYIAIFLGSFFGIIGLPHFVMRFFTVRDAKEARWSTVLCVFLVGLVNTTVYATGFAAVYYMQTQGVDIPTAAYDYVVFILVEALAGEGWLALAVAGSVAAGLSTVAGLLMIMGAGLIHDLYGAIKPDVDDEKKLKLSYGAMLVVGVLVILFSLNPPEFILEAIMWAFGIAAAGLGVPIVMGIWWKRTNKYGVAAGMIVGSLIAFVSWIMIGYMGMDPVEIPFPIFAKYFYGPLGWIKVTAIAVPISFILTVVVSWLTPAPGEELQRQVDEMHGWSDYDPKRYNGKGLPITVIVLSVVVMWFMTTLYDMFPK